MTVNFDRQLLKEALKEALTETLHEERSFLYEVISDVLEDFALTEAIREGQQTEFVDRSDIFDLLEPAE